MATNETISISMDGVLEGVADRLVLQSPAGQKALKSTVREMSNWLARQVKRALAKSLNVRQKDLNKAIKSRLKTRVIAKEFYADVWIGLEPFPLIYLGAEQHGQGVVWADKHLRLGSFIATIRGKENVYRRKYRGSGSTRQSRQALGESRTRRGYLGSLPDNLAGRFPLELQRVEIYRQALSALKKVEAQAAEEFRKRLVRRLDFYINSPQRSRTRK